MTTTWMNLVTGIPVVGMRFSVYQVAELSRVRRVSPCPFRQVAMRRVSLPLLYLPDRIVPTRRGIRPETASTTMCGVTRPLSDWVVF